MLRMQREGLLEDRERIVVAAQTQQGGREQAPAFAIRWVGVHGGPGSRVRLLVPAHAFQRDGSRLQQRGARSPAGRRTSQRLVHALKRLHEPALIDQDDGAAVQRVGMAGVQRERTVAGAQRLVQGLRGMQLARRLQMDRHQVGPGVGQCRVQRQSPLQVGNGLRQPRQFPAGPPHQVWRIRGRGIQRGCAREALQCRLRLALLEPGITEVEVRRRIVRIELRGARVAGGCLPDPALAQVRIALPPQALCRCRVRNRGACGGRAGGTFLRLAQPDELAERG